MERTCSCGNHVNENGDSVSQKPTHDEHQLDSSFVHLPSPPANIGSSSSSSKQRNDSILFNHGLLRTHQYVSSLLKVTEENLQLGGQDENKSDGCNDEEQICLCNSCIQRYVIL